MTVSQSQATWELCRQGFPLMADEAQKHWERGESYQPNGQIRVSREVGHLIDCCNWEVCGSSEAS